MRKIFLISFCLSTSITNAQWQWAMRAGSGNSEMGCSSATDGSGNVYVTGYFLSGNITFGSFTLNSLGGNDVFVVKYNASGIVLWAKSFGGGGGGDDESFSITADISGNTYITGYFKDSSITFGSFTLINSGLQDVFIVKLNSSGVVQWAKSATNCFASYGQSIKIDASGNILVTGVFFGTAINFGSTTINSTNSNSTDIFIVKYNSAGSVVWLRDAGGIDVETPNNITADATGNFYITGYFQGPSTKFGSITLNNSNNGTFDIFIVKYNTSGTALWAKSAGGNKNEEGKGLVTDANGYVYLTGYFESTTILFGSITLNNIDNTGMSEDIFITKYDASGNVVWSKREGGTDSDIGYGIVVDANSDIYVTGFFANSNIIFGNDTLYYLGIADVFLVKYDSSGNIIWAESAGGISEDISFSISIDLNSNLYLTGYFWGAACTFGNTTLNNSGVQDVFLAKHSSLSGINEFNLEEIISVYPNPSTGIFTLQSTKEITAIEIYNVLGENISPLSLRRGVGGEVEINLSEAAKGIYFIKIITPSPLGEGWGEVYSTQKLLIR